jgi:hypothetical protein
MNAIKRFMKIYLSYYGHNSLEISLLGGPLEKKTNNLALAPRQSKELFEPVAAYDIAQIRHNCIRALMARTTTTKKKSLFNLYKMPIPLFIHLRNVLNICKFQRANCYFHECLENNV